MSRSPSNLQLSLTVIVFVVMLINLRATPATPSCAANVRYPRAPINPPYSMCSETIITFPRTEGIASITAIAFGPDGALYFARPATSQIDRIMPDANGFIAAPTSPDQAQVFAANLPEPPNGLTYYDGAWYVSGDTTIARLRDTKGSGVADYQQVIVHDLPGGVGGWLGNIHVGPDKRLYVAKAASCDSCIESDPRRAALLSFAVDGSDPRIVARGLHDSYDFTWLPDSLGGGLAIVDDAGSADNAELNLIPKGQTSGNSANVPDFGWPGCDSQGKPMPIQGVQNGNPSAPQNCSSTVKPVATFEADSHPMGVVFYAGDAFRVLKGSLLVALGGSWNAGVTSGYSIWLLRFDSSGPVGTPAWLIPDPNSTYHTISDASMNMTSFYPDHPTGIAVDGQGWLYVSVSEGRIYRFRPRS